MATPDCSRRRSLAAMACLCGILIVVAGTASAGTQSACLTPVLTLAEAALLLRIDEAELQRLAEQGQVPGRLVGSSWRFDCAAIIGWLNQQAPVGEAPDEQNAEDILLRGQRVLLARGSVVIDLGQVYSRSDDNSLVAVDGAIALATSTRELFATLLVGWIGLFEETELFASTTFRVQRGEQILGGLDLASSRDEGIGDVQLGVRRTLLREGAGRPDVVLTVDSLVPTGDTPYGAGAGLVLVKSVDPVVLFANVSYRRLFNRDAVARAASYAEHAWGISMGYGLGLNDTLAISMAVSSAFAGDTMLDDTRSQGANVFGARFGLTSWLARGLYIEPSVSFALNGPGNSFAFAVTLPYAF